MLSDYNRGIIRFITPLNVLVGALLNQNWLILQLTIAYGVIFGGKVFMSKQKVVTIFVCIPALVCEQIQGQDRIFIKCFLIIKTGLICRVIIVILICVR